ncbi:MAG: hypothetical protein AAGA77_14100 [Bacteroidota bacterium]
MKLLNYALLLGLFLSFYSCGEANSKGSTSEMIFDDYVDYEDEEEDEVQIRRMLQIQELGVEIEQVEDSIQMMRESAGHYARELQKAEGYFRLVFESVLCNDVDVRDEKVVFLMLTEDECMEATEASKLYAANECFSLFAGNQDENGYPTHWGIKVKGTPIFKSALICDSLGNQSLPYKLNFLYEIDTLERHDTTARYGLTEEEGFNEQENKEFWIDTVYTYDTLFTYYSDIQVKFGLLEDIENKLIRAKGVDKTELQETKEVTQNQIKKLRMLSNEVVAKHAMLELKLGRLQTKMIRLKTHDNDSDFMNQILKG